LRDGPIGVFVCVSRWALVELAAQNQIAIPCFLSGWVIHLTAISEITVSIFAISESSDPCSDSLPGQGLYEMLEVAGIQSIEVVVSHWLPSSLIDYRTPSQLSSVM